MRCGGWDVGAGGLGEALRVIPLPPQTPWCNENPQNLTVREKLPTQTSAIRREIPEESGLPLELERHIRGLGHEFHRTSYRSRRDLTIGPVGSEIG